jgi:hypothetical protein
MRLYPVNYILMLAAAGFALPALAGYRVAWWNTSSGGARCTGGVYRLAGTVGQTIPGSTAKSGLYSVTPGFQVIVLQGEEAPELRIMSSRGQVVLAWSDAAGTFVLEEAVSLTRPDWKAVTEIPRLTGDERRVSVPAEARDRFFRLRRR